MSHDHQADELAQARAYLLSAQGPVVTNEVEALRLLSQSEAEADERLTLALDGTRPTRTSSPDTAGAAPTCGCASPIVGKLSASSRQNALAAALKEYGAIRRTIYAAKYLSDEGYRRKIARQLNKGESIHALRRQLHYAREGKVVRRQPAQQNEQAWCLTVVTNAVIWHCEYMGLAVGELCGAGREVDGEVLAHISPARSASADRSGRGRGGSTPAPRPHCGPHPHLLRRPGR